MDSNLLSIAPSAPYQTTGGSATGRSGKKNPLISEALYGSDHFESLTRGEKIMKSHWSASNPDVALPKNFTFDADGIADQQPIQNALRQYYNGMADEKTIENTLSTIIAQKRAYYTDLGVDPNEFTAQLIEDVYDYARLQTVGEAYNASWKEGLPMAAAQYGGDQNVRSWAYYNADYFYRSEDMKQTLTEIAARIGEKYGVNDLKLSTEYDDGDIRKEMYSSYNTMFNFKNRDNHRIISMIDETTAPPEGFRFLYVDNQQGKNQAVPRLAAPRNEPEAFFDCYLKVWQGDWSFTGRVPVRQNRYEFPVSVNMLDILTEHGAAFPEEIAGFLKNFDFFSPVLSGEYMKLHPRNY